MRRVLSMVLVASGLLGLTLGLLGASLGFGAVAASAAAGKKVCTITDERMTELSGMIATSSGYVLVNDGSEDASRERVFLLDNKCKLKKAVQFASNPRDPEDLALSADGKTVWIADTGDNDSERRSSVVLWSMPVSGASKPVLHRLTFPGNKRHDAEALLIGADDVPLIITKTTGKAEIFKPSAALEKNNDEGVPLTKAGEISLPKSTTANPFGGAGRVTVTGGASSPDGGRVVLRTYADAFEWDVQGDDLVKTLTTGKPRMTALADPFGEAIAYTADGKSFLTVSDVASLNDEEAEVTVLSYTPAKELAAAAGGSEADTKKSAGSWTSSLTLDDITYLIAAVGVLGALLVGLGIFGIVRARKRPRDDGLGAVGPGGDDLDPRAGRDRAPGGDREQSGGRRSDYDDDSNWGPARSGGYDDGYRSDRPADDYEPAGRGRSSGGGGVYGGKPAGGGVYGGAKPAGDGGGYGGSGGRPQGGGGRPQGAGGGRPQGAGGGRPQQGAGGRAQGGGGGGRPQGGGGRSQGGGRAPGGGVYGGSGGAPAGRPRAGGGGGGGVYGGQPSGGTYGNGNGRGGRPGPDDQWSDQPRSGQGAGPRGGAPRGGQYGQPRQRSGRPPDDHDYR
ncbi:hypothetical protein O7626_07595 [Micromonospora sp. WMMD1102]|uniref:hypothetical protein n=1 Tax=Micromonospora sp. WMMD1102 TaxID=3016105 RepID=UPI0024156AD3|nr:hypothetical protein [Micromonospora sp. WMMD1102]MDG4785791.1 hypothetical protein [Micromonospora sp. WMMD1102]